MATKIDTRDARQDAEQMISAADPVRDLRNDLELLGFTMPEDRDRALLVYIACTARLLGEGQATLIIGNSGAGKSHLAREILRCMPKEDRIELASASPKALLGYPENENGEIDLRNMIIRIDERPKATEDERWMRTLLSEGVATVSSLVGRTAREKRLVGFPSVIESTTQRHIGEEDESRRIVVDIPDSEDRTMHALMAMNEAVAGLADVLPEEIYTKHQEVQRLLPSDLEVIIPFAEHILPQHARLNHYRRLLRQLHAITGAVALVRYRERYVDNRTRTIQAEVEDYGVARELLQPVLQRITTNLSQDQLQMLNTIDRELGRRPAARPGFERSFTVEAATRWLGLNRRTVGRRMDPLIKDGLLDADYPDGRNRARVFTLPLEWREILNAPGSFPTADEIRKALEHDAPTARRA